MSELPKGDESAFPRSHFYFNATGVDILGVPGLTKREWLVGLAMQSLIIAASNHDLSKQHSREDIRKMVAEEAGAQADEILKQAGEMRER